MLRRLLNNKWVNLIAVPALLSLGAWLGSILWGLIANAPLDAKVQDLGSRQTKTETSVEGIQQDVRYIRDRVDAIYDRLPASTAK